MSVLLGWMVARATLGPLNDLTGVIEDVAETTDVSTRLDPRGVDELGRLRRAFNRLLEGGGDLAEAQRQLVLDASHELRTPLTSLRTNLEVVRRVDELPPGDREVLVADVLTQMGELTQLVGDLAELARGENRQAGDDHDPSRPAGGGRRDGGGHPRTPQGCALQHDAGADVGGGAAGTDRAGRGQPARQRVKWSPDDAVVEVTCAAR